MKTTVWTLRIVVTRIVGLAIACSLFTMADARTAVPVGFQRLTYTVPDGGKIEAGI